MKRLLASALGALALGMGSGEVKAQESKQPVSSQVISKDVGKAPVVLDGGACNNGCCDNGGGHFVGGFGLYFIQPNFETNPIGRVATVDANGNTTARFADFRYHVDAAPSFWLGYVGESGFGFRMRYFEYAHGADELFDVPVNAGTTVTSASPLGVGIFSFGGGEQIFANSDLNVLTWDFEATQRWDCGCWTLEGAAGLRYAHMSQNYRLTATQDLLRQGAATQTIISGHNFNGAGPTAAFEAKRRLGDGGLALYSNVRGSILFGSAKQQVNTSGPDQNNVGIITTDVNAHQSDVLPIGELEFGTEFSRNMGRANGVFQLGFVGSVWWGGGNAANSPLTTFPVAGDNSSNFGFVGFVARLGVNY